MAGRTGAPIFTTGPPEGRILNPVLSYLRYPKVIPLQKNNIPEGFMPWVPHGVLHRCFPEKPSRSNISDSVHLGPCGTMPRECVCQAHDFLCGPGPGSVWSVTLCCHQILQSCCCWSQDSLQQNTKLIPARAHMIEEKYAPKPADTKGRRFLGKIWVSWQSHIKSRKGAWKNWQKSLWAGTEGSFRNTDIWYPILHNPDR